MSYRTARETAEAWGISVSRLNLLARNGRIPGATQIGRAWLFPADAEKPSDRRRSAAALPEEKPFFRFPYLIDRAPEAFDPPLSEEELRLRDAQLALHACRFAEAEAALGELPTAARTIYVRAGALSCRAILSCMGCDRTGYIAARGALEALAAETPDRVPELRAMLYEIDLFLGCNELQEPDFDPRHEYSEALLYRFAARNSYRMMIRSSYEAVVPELLTAEVDCRLCEAGGHRLEAQLIHLCLARMYRLRQDPETAQYHFMRALAIAREHELYLYMAGMLYYVQPNPKEDAFFPDDPFLRELMTFAGDIHERYSRFCEVMGFSSVYGRLSGRDLQYICYASSGLTNKEIAERTGLSPATVANYYAALCDRLGVNGKKGLRELYVRNGSGEG